jgi:hypothetical protein
MSAKLQTSPDTTAPAPPDLAMMRETAGLVLGPNSGTETLPPAGGELDTLTATLRGHLELLAPEVEQAAARLPKDSPTRRGALACVGEARGKLRAPELSFARLSGSVTYARRLARVLVALCDHYEIVSAGVEETPEQSAFVCLAEHCLTCPTCLAMDDKGARLNLPCETREQLNEEYREACAQARAGRQRRAGASV